MNVEARFLSMWLVTAIVLLMGMSFYWYDSLHNMLIELRLPDLSLFVGLAFVPSLIGVALVQVILPLVPYRGISLKLQLIFSLLIATAVLVIIASYLKKLMTIT